VLNSKLNAFFQTQNDNENIFVTAVELEIEKEAKPTISYASFSNLEKAKFIEMETSLKPYQ
jgi:hypothetical protein